jgi:HD-like signal output (HDOD) protein
MKRGILCFLTDSTALFDLQILSDIWEITFVRSRQCALDALAKTSFEAVATDVCGADGAEGEFLGDVARLFPDVARILLFNLADKPANEKGRALADQCMPKPCPADIFVDAIGRARLLHKLLADPAVTKLLSRLHKVPSVPSIYFRLVQMLQSPNSHLAEVAQVMSEDLVMTAKLLQMANSPFFGMKRTINSLEEAVTHLGLAQTKTLVLLTQVFANYVEEKASRFSLAQLWRHSMGTARFARRIVNHEFDDPVLAETAFTAGLLHDVGKLFFAVNCPKDFDGLVGQAERNAMSYVNAERKLLGTTHAQLGACVLGTWGLPSEILESIAFHHTPSLHPGNSFCPLTAVHVGNFFEHGLNSGPSGTQACLLDHGYLRRIGCEHRLSAWRELCFAIPAQHKIPA